MSLVISCVGHNHKMTTFMKNLTWFRPSTILHLRLLLLCIQFRLKWDLGSILSPARSVQKPFYPCAVILSAAVLNYNYFIRMEWRRNENTNPTEDKTVIRCSAPRWDDGSLFLVFGLYPNPVWCNEVQVAWARKTFVE